MKTEQLTLGGLISLLEKQPQTNHIEFDFCWSYPKGLCSWRGSYDILAIVVSFYGYGVPVDKPEDRPTVDSFIKVLKDAVGKSFEGWGNGEFRMDENTPLYITTHWGNSCNTAPIGVAQTGYDVTMITTAHIDY